MTGKPTDEEIIRKAVELAEGFSNGRGFVIYRSRPMGCPVDNQEMLDALAAQLVRQVDAHESAWIDISSNGCCRIFCGDGDKEMATQLGPDRTMNTLRVIVESGVLE